MILYHGSINVISTPKIIDSNRFLDFGKGFYTTQSFEQARNWANRVKIRHNVNKCFVSEFEFDYDKAINDLIVFSFKKADKKWLEFVMTNRKGISKENYDLVIGPVADDQVYDTIRLYETGRFSLDDTIKRLKTHLLFNQILFHSERSLNYIKFTDFQEVTINGQ